MEKASWRQILIAQNVIIMTILIIDGSDKGKGTVIMQNTRILFLLPVSFFSRIADVMGIGRYKAVQRKDTSLLVEYTVHIFCDVRLQSPTFSSLYSFETTWWTIKLLLITKFQYKDFTWFIRGFIFQTLLQTLCPWVKCVGQASGKAIFWALFLCRENWFIYDFMPSKNSTKHRHK